MTKEQAKEAVLAKLSALKLTEKMSASERLVFCIDMHNRFKFPSKIDSMTEIRNWVDNWQNMWLRSN
jgi:hypothetical protein